MSVFKLTNYYFKITTRKQVNLLWSSDIRSRTRSLTKVKVLIQRRARVGSLSVSYTCLRESSPPTPPLSLRWWFQHQMKLCVAQQLLEVRRGSISLNVIWHSTQRQLHGADDSAKPCLWRLHARCCRAVI